MAERVESLVAIEGHRGDIPELYVGTKILEVIAGMMMNGRISSKILMMT
jgi:hypothetical protein